MKRLLTLRKATLLINGGTSINLVDTADNKLVDEAEGAIEKGRAFRGVVDGKLTLVPFHAIVDLVVTDTTQSEVEYEDGCETNSCGGF